MMIANCQSHFSGRMKDDQKPSHHEGPEIRAGWIDYD
jgi:hypothetical protein